jgi:hypothetical protein
MKRRRDRVSREWEAEKKTFAVLVCVVRGKVLCQCHSVHDIHLPKSVDGLADPSRFSHCIRCSHLFFYFSLTRDGRVEPKIYSFSHVRYRCAVLSMQSVPVPSRPRTFDTKPRGRVREDRQRSVWTQTRRKIAWTSRKPRM